MKVRVGRYTPLIKSTEIETAQVCLRYLMFRDMWCGTAESAE